MPNQRRNDACNASKSDILRVEFEATQTIYLSTGDMIVSKNVTKSDGYLSPERIRDTCEALIDLRAKLVNQ